MHDTSIVAGGFSDATAMVELGPNLFVTTRTTDLQDQRTANGGLYMIPKAGGDAQLIAIDHRGAAYNDLALEDASIVVGTSDGRIDRIPTYGGEMTEVLSGSPAILSVAVDDTHVYFAHVGNKVLSVDKAGKNAMLLTQPESAVHALGLGGGTLYVASANATSGALTRIDTTTGASSNVATTMGSLCGLAVSSESAYMTSLAGGVFSAKLAGGQVSAIAQAQPSPCSVTSDKQNVFWLASSGANLWRADQAGNAAVPIASIADVVASPKALVVNDDAIYVLTKSSIVKVAK